MENYLYWGNHMKGRYRKITPGSKNSKRIYLSVMLWFVGRAIQAASRVDREVKREFDQLPESFTFCLGVMPNGPHMIVQKNSNGRVSYAGHDPGTLSIDLNMKIKNIEAAMLMFTFQESAAMATCRDRLIVDGEVPPACAVLRILNMVEVFLLPRIVARLAVKRYPEWRPVRKYLGRARIYFRTIAGY
jgi:aldehyde:ferredoxin oxidoreductase